MNQSGYIRINLSIFLAALLVVVVLVYQYFAYSQVDTGERQVVADTTFTQLQLFQQSLPVLSHGYYEMWVSDEANRLHSLGKFNLNASGNLVDALDGQTDRSFFSLPQAVRQPTGVAITISAQQTSGGDFVRFLEGDINNDRGNLQFNQVDLSSSSGQYMLATPTDNDTFLNEKSGVWFGDAITNKPGLLLPPLPSGWVYEGWAVSKDRTITTGRFTSTNQSDRFAGFSDVQAASPNFPGEDLLKNPPVAVFPSLIFPLDMAGQEVKISLEPDIRGVDPTGAAPFALSFLSAKVPGRADAQKLYDLEYSDSDFPKVTVVLR